MAALETIPPVLAMITLFEVKNNVSGLPVPMTVKISSPMMLPAISAYFGVKKPGFRSKSAGLSE